MHTEEPRKETSHTTTRTTNGQRKSLLGIMYHETYDDVKKKLVTNNFSVVTHLHNTMNVRLI